MMTNPRRSRRQTPEKTPVSMRTKLILGAVLVTLIGGGTWFMLYIAERDRQKAYDAAVAAHDAALLAIEDANIATYRKNIIDMGAWLSHYAGARVKGHKFSELKVEYDAELEAKALTAFPQFAAKFSDFNTSQDFWTMENLSQKLSKEERLRWMEDSLIHYRRLESKTDEKRLEQRKAEIRKLKQHIDNKKWQAIRDKASLSESYTMSLLVIGNGDMAMTSDHITALRQTLLNALGARFTPVTILARTDNNESGGKGHIVVEVAASYVFYESTSITPIATGLGGHRAVPEEFAAKITITPSGLESTTQAFQVKEQAPDQVSIYAPSYLRDKHFEILMEKISQKINEIQIP